MHLALIPLLALGASIIAHLIALRLFPPLGLLDHPERYDLKRGRLPYPSGIIAVATFLTFFGALQPMLSEPWSLQNQGLIVAIVLLALLAFRDDRTPLPWWLRLTVQILCALIVFLTGTRIFALTNPLEAITGMPHLPLDTFVIPSSLFSDPSAAGALFTILWLGLTMNALNWFDGVPGQVSTVSSIGFLTIGFLSLSTRVDQPSLALLAFVLAAISTGGLLFDFPPAKVLMGDTGAMFFGLMLGVLTIYAGGKVATAFLVLGVPLIDFAIVIARRTAKGASIVRGNTRDEHLHHRLLAKGWSPRAVIALTASLGAAFGITALFLSTLQKFVAAFLLVAMMIFLSWYSRLKKENS